jgi:hypothetical protein
MEQDRTRTSSRAIDACLIIGLGGTGTILLEPVLKLLTYHPNGTTNVAIADCDYYEEKNLERQIFNPDKVNMNKAAAKAKELESVFDNLLVFEQRVDPDTLPQILGILMPKPDSRLLVISAVDNDRSRHHLIKYLDANVENYVLINPGNMTSTVYVSTHIQEDGAGVTVHPFERYKNIREPQDRMVGSCEGIVVEVPQTISANMMSAAVSLMTLSNYLDGKELDLQVIGKLDERKIVGIGPYKLWQTN